MKTLKKTRQLLMYMIAIVVLIFGTIALVYFAQGYSYDFKSGQIRNSGLVLLDSNPNSADISINGIDTNNRTPYRYEGPPNDNLTVDLKKTGYRSWTTKQSVIAGEVTFIEYPLLLPKVLPRQSLLQPVEFSSFSTSEDNKKAAAVSKSATQLYFINENGSAIKIYENLNSKINSALMAPDAKNVLVNQTSPTGLVEQLLVNTTNNQVTNLTANHGSVYNNLQFSPTNSSEMFWLENGILRKLNTQSHDNPTVLLNNVSYYSLSKDRIISSVPGELPGISSLIISTNLSGGDKKNVAALPADTLGYSSLLIHSRFHTYLIVRANSSPNSLYSIYEPGGSNTLPLKLDDNVSLFSSSPNQKYLSYLNNTGIHSLDLEAGRNYSHNLNTTSITSIGWFDNFHLVLHEDKYSSIVDFDGYNQHAIIANSLFSFLLPSNSKSVLYLNISGGLEKVYLEPR